MTQTILGYPRHLISKAKTATTLICKARRTALMEGPKLIKRVNWLEVKVSDIKTAKKFYSDILGLKIKQEWPGYVIFDLPGTLTFALMLGGKKGRKEGAPNIYLAVSNLDEEYKTLKEKGVNFIEPPKKQYWGGYAALFADPDENLFYLTQTQD
jgi:predicted enzyme related to lactoylglutathione lyase